MPEVKYSLKEGGLGGGRGKGVRDNLNVLLVRDIEHMLRDV